MFYPNALHAEFHERMYAAVLAASPTKFNIAEAMLNGYKQHIDEEIDLNKAAQKSVHSQTLAQADSLRDADLSVLIGTVDINRLSPDAAKRDAAIALAVVLDPYRKIANEGTEAETLHVKGLLVDMAKDEEAAKALGITYDEYIARKKAGTLPKEEKKPSKPRTPSERPADLLDSSSGGDTGGGGTGGDSGGGGTDEKPGGI